MHHEGVSHRHVSALETRPRHTEICHHDATSLFELFREWFGPVATIWHTLEEPHRGEFREAWISLAEKFNVAQDGTCVIPSEYLEVVAVKA